jgi:hypothetical protein
MFVGVSGPLQQGVPAQNLIRAHGNTEACRDGLHWRPSRAHRASEPGIDIAKAMTGPTGRLRRRPLPQRVDDIPPSGPPLADRRPDCLEADADRPSGVQCFRARYAEPVHFGAQLGVRRVSRFKALYGKAKGRALDGTSLPESLVADRTNGLCPHARPVSHIRAHDI